MLHLRLTASADRASALEEALSRAEGLVRVASAPAAGGDGAVLEADLHHHVADDLIATLERLEVRSEDYILSHLEIIAPIPSAQRDVTGGRGFAWVEVLGEARVNARPLGRYHALMAVAGVVAAEALLAAGSVVWASNIIAFALLYWELDGGGAAARAHHRPAHALDLAFPQHMNPELSPPAWRPRFVDYLYLGFTNATAFSPTDAMPLAPWAKMTMAAQALISLAVLGLVIARAVNVFA